MTNVEINFDGLVGPTHNYAGLSEGNLASQTHAGRTAHPRQAALQGLSKMRTLIRMGVPQGFLPPPLRPVAEPLRRAGFRGVDREVLGEAAQIDPALFRASCSAASMWRANAATVIAAEDAFDARIHLVVANLAAMLHRSMEADDTFALLTQVFSDPRHFQVHPPLPASHFADEGAANHMRLSQAHGARGLNLFVHGPARAGTHPVRQSRRASQSLARLCADPGRAALIEQSSAAVEAGAFHNDVVAVSNLDVMLAHPEAFTDFDAMRAAVESGMDGAKVVAVEGLSLGDAVSSYLFNSQIVSLPDGGMALVLPVEVRENAAAHKALDAALGQTDEVRKVVFVEVRESMRNGGGPACLRLRVPVDASARAAIHPGYLLTESRLDALERIVEAHWPLTVTPADLVDPAMWETARAADAALTHFIRAADSALVS
jgi:succinylarginine dihydrolase